MALTDTEFHNAWKTQYVPGAPESERDEARQQAFSHVYDAGSALRLARELPQGVRESQVALADIEKAIRQAGRVRRPEVGTKRQAIFDDPLISWANVQGTRPRMGRIPPQLLRSMARSNPIKAAILQIMTNRTLRHAQYVESGVQAMIEGAEGFDLFPTFKDAHEELTESEKREKLGIVNFILNSGHVGRFTDDGSPNREDYERESFEQVLAQMIKQRYILDSRALEIERSRNGKVLMGWYVVDGATISRTDPREWPYLNSPEARANPKAKFVQVWRNQVVTSFGSNDLYYDYANPSDEIGQRGYGMSEVEMSIKLTTGILNILTTNNAIFDRGALPPGILTIAGQLSQESLEEIREEWDAYRLGAGGQWGMPMMNIRDPQGKVAYLRTDGNPSEMVFEKYVNFLAAIDCAVFGVDVTEVNVSSFGGNNARLSSGKDTQTRIDESKNRAFHPNMNRLETGFNEILGPAYDYRWRFGFVGLQRQDAKMLREDFMKVATVDEVRQVMYRLKPLGGTQGQALALNPSIAQMTIASLKSGGDEPDNGVRQRGDSTPRGDSTKGKAAKKPGGAGE